MGRRQAVIATGTPVAGIFAIATSTSHHRQWSRVSLRINGGEGKLLSRLIKVQRSKVSGSAPRYLYHRGKTESTIQNLRSGSYVVE
jgi:hypothetical protein